ncbi:rhodanese-like domain-containing protein [Rhodoferax lacus]|uniref:rhodanese-like domain-containing protein n=1 Tax=Rhodoferax lacus TaxID=2184758 RepID=UPI0018F54FB2|nr:rhodanese-like domain-containing protein [Rhodoferax lacus]
MKRKLILAGLSMLLAGAAFARDVLIDVRTAQEFQSGHLQGAINMPHTSIGEEIANARVSKDDRLIVYCKSGRRATLASDTLKGLGYSNVENFGGLEEASKRLQLPVHTDK